MADSTRYAVYSLFGALAVGAIVAACSAPDPGDIPVRSPPKDPKLARLPEAGAVLAPTTSIAVGAFEGAAPYTAGAAQLQSVHQKHADQLEIGPPGNPYEKDCLVCHTGTGVAATAGKTFAAAGSVRTTKSGGPAGKGIEVRIRAPDGKAESAYTDDSGNWFMRTFAGGTTVPLGAIVGVRNGTATGNMVGIVGGTPDTTGCAKTPSCHGPGSVQGPVYLTP